MADDRMLSRRNMLRAAALAVAGVGAGAVLAACGAPAASPTTAPTTKPAAPAAGATTAPSSGAAPAATTAPAAAAPKPATGAPVTIRFTTWWEPLAQYLKEAQQLFEAANPGITVNTEFIPGT